jgi:hypothetical protein
MELSTDEKRSLRRAVVNQITHVENEVAKAWARYTLSTEDGKAWARVITELEIELGRLRALKALLRS